MGNSSMVNSATISFSRFAFQGLVLTTIVILACRCSSASSAQDELPHWIWSSNQKGIELRHEFEVESRVQSATMQAAFDHCRGEVLIGDVRVGMCESYGAPLRIDVTELMNIGTHQIHVNCENLDGPPAFAFRLTLEYENEERLDVVSSNAWQARAFDTGAWSGVESLGQTARLINSVEFDRRDIGPEEDYTQWKRALESGEGTSPTTFDVPDGFEVTLIRSALPNEDSWVSMTEDPQGRWIIAREKKGLLRVTLPAKDDEKAQVDEINPDLAECRGLVFIDGKLFAMANNDKALFRLQDTDGDDQFDEVIRLSDLRGDVGHGRNQICKGPDGMLYAICGDAVFLPENAASLVPALAEPNEIETTRHGYVIRTDPSEIEWEIVVQGLRNPFGIDFNQNGDMFTYDADAEYDMGAPWYRPTRVLHLMPGGDYYWRRVTQRWPPYFPDRPDMPQPTVEIGKGSPTSVSFCKGDSFPSQYRDTCFVLDWAYGRILAVDFEPYGASYHGTVETFLRGRPLNVTDVEFGSDGSMYFITGGRGTQSALYRVTFTGDDENENEPSIQQRLRETHAVKNREILKGLHDSFGNTDTESIEPAWQLLGHADPWVRHAARTALEWVPASAWTNRIASESDIETKLAATIALARVGDEDNKKTCLSIVADLLAKPLTVRQFGEALFVAERCFEQLEPSDSDEWREKITRELDASFPYPDHATNLRLALFLSNWGDAETFVSRVMHLLKSATRQHDRLHYLFVLREVRAGWTEPLREAYFEQLRQSNQFISGAGMPTFLRLIQEQSLATIASEADRERYASSLNQSLIDEWTDMYGNEPRPFVREWTMDALNDALDDVEALKSRDLERGKDLFAQTKCVICHRFERRGGVIGPDLSNVASRFGANDLLRSIVEPSNVVAEKYRSDTFVLSDGRVLTGQLVGGDYRADKVSLVPDLLNPNETIEFSKQDIEDRIQSPLSAMPKGLLNELTPEEILDLLAYLLSKSEN